jgi:hypothetical protein
MPYQQLTGGSYSSRSLISAAQRCLNLYTEGMGSDAAGEPSPVAHLCTPGLTVLSESPSQTPIRGLYTASNGNLYCCAGTFLFFIDTSWQWHAVADFIGSAPSDVVPRDTPVSMADNGTNLILVDGSVDGYVINILTNDPTTAYQINAGNYLTTDPTGGGFLGGDRVDYTDTFFILNQPGTPNFYCSGSEAVTFDPLDFAGKTAKADNLESLIVEHRVIWLFGQYSTEVWFNSGGGGSGALTNNNFPFESMPGTFFPRGLAAKYSLAKSDNQIFWLSQDTSGQGVVMRGLGYSASRISTHAIEYEFSKYPVISDARGFCYQQSGHTWYVLTFPTADKTWVCDATSPNSATWHERCWLDPVSGRERRHRANCCTFAYGTVVVGDHEEGTLYAWDLNNYTDAGSPIKRLVSFPHNIDTNSGARMMFRRFVANMQVGTSGSNAAAQTVINTSFNATDGTLLENYANNGDIGSTFQHFGGTAEGEIVNNRLVGLGGFSQYLASGTPLTPNYTVSFQAVPTEYDVAAVSGKSLFAIGRSNLGSIGYKVAIVSDGSQYNLVLTIMDTSVSTTVAMGLLTSGYYTISLVMTGTAINALAHRSVDGNWLSPTGWSGSPATAIAITDATATAPGYVVIGGNW